ncbi:N-acetylglucosaminyldiphosphoundecaprenol N-acetyl-beta-D-mannosaminyltransferase [Carnobacterium iners]|uniref:N-acetylglucosaminyldiphosphoundecaprenol N-acetyl-beta-D-mannosaminyltransferase n=1 Tax=Carnobacterium iners TaxID=1073423 RepID=A0A1X7N8C4_9LACT|nr:WecB/TagA/CpsF family glycosyltransferase [Carnobacterium iners]SEL20779.1 N-acetylglucosaminyldiphosphoundecaprenol N-acetyl-beta-D-mannosaminyltransferase [Carnobacterium iners]SMH33800.1 N-acetylglucosaminyldiphosphoundecaprenol N-acetyl-beta-D-mannosaminyltransferase [Carnobacterium iners]
MEKNQKVTVLDIDFDNVTQDDLVDQLNQCIHSKQKIFVVTANPEIVMYANQNPDYMDILRKADYITADGIGIVKGARILGTPIVERVAGYDLMLELLKKADQFKYSMYLVGAKEEVIVKAVKKIKKEYPNITLKGYHNGYFKLSDKEVMGKVLQAQTDIVFVGLGFPKQEKWIQNYLDQAPKGLVMGVGGSFDAFTGTVKRAPKFIIKLNLEWFYRLIKQPTRFKRMLMIPKFLIAIYKEKRKNI